MPNQIQDAGGLLLDPMTMAYGSSAKDAALDGQVIPPEKLEDLAGK
jgi:hypothetical protein